MVNMDSQDSVAQLDQIQQIVYMEPEESLVYWALKGIKVRSFESMNVIFQSENCLPTHKKCQGKFSLHLQTNANQA